MAWSSRSSLADLKSRVSRFGVEWRRSTGRQLATARDGIDFLTAMKGRDDFWAALVPVDAAATLPIDAAALREALPSRQLPPDVSTEDYLRSLGLSESDVVALVTDLDESALVERAIRSAFEERTPQKVARALESVLDADRDVLATECYVGRLTESGGLGRTLGVLMGTALLLVGTTLGGCGPQTTSPAPSPTSTQPSTTSPQPTPNNTSGTAANPEVPPPEPTPPEPAPPEPNPDPLPPPTPAYKGVSPRRRALRRRAAGPALPQ